MVAQEEQAEERRKIITIAGGINMVVEHIDGSTETVKVRQIPATMIEPFMQKLADEATSVSIYCDRPREWCDTITHESITAICKKGLELNESFLGAWCQRRAKWMEMMNVGVIAELQKKLDSLNDILVSVNSSQKSPTITDSPRKK